jgi:hypothetical protein
MTDAGSTTDDCVAITLASVSHYRSSFAALVVDLRAWTTAAIGAMVPPEELSYPEGCLGRRWRKS